MYIQCMHAYCKQVGLCCGDVCAGGYNDGQKVLHLHIDKKKHSFLLLSVAGKDCLVRYCFLWSCL